ncbi:CehA/McbA family metallohydrolase domain-containing protein [Phenylobacterium zucineum]|uniref:phosphoesterase n=1 Tax=Phenylobacterium zucineum TaxID=284016 RepID=UPI0011D0B091|nr:phosphoesterase [Phenylobacterium zucineum]
MRRLLSVGAAALVLLPAAANAHGPHGHGTGFAPAPGAPASRADPAQRRWQAGDHHVHSWYSADWKPAADGASPPEPIIGGDSSNSIPTNARMALRHGLRWMVATDHGGPNHSRLNREKAYPELVQSRRQVPGLIQFFGMELDTPAAEHSSVILPKTADEADVLFGIEKGYNRREPWPADPARDTEARMIAALKHMDALPAKPVVIANHPSRTAKAVGEYGQVAPAELRGWNDAAPQVAVGMEGAPGHQAAALNADGSPGRTEPRGSYGGSPTLGGFDQMTARLGGFWDSMLAEGRRWWVTSTSDSHRHYTEGGEDFWPGEYSKTYVKAVPAYEDVLDGLRNGRVFVTLGDLVSELEVTVQTADGRRRAEIGGTLKIPRGSDVTVVIRARDPAGKNFGGRSPEVARVDLIRSEVTGPVADRSSDTNPRARVEKRFTPRDWVREGERLSMTVTLKAVTEPTYVRVRGTNGDEAEPLPDTTGEDPWSDLWFYSNPVFIEVE